MLPILAASDGNTKDALACHPRWVRFRAQCVRRGPDLVGGDLVPHLDAGDPRLFSGLVAKIALRRL